MSGETIGGARGGGCDGGRRRADETRIRRHRRRAGAGSPVRQFAPSSMAGVRTQRSKAP
jgi:hypothetical protein